MIIELYVHLQPKRAFHTQSTYVPFGDTLKIMGLFDLPKSPRKFSDGNNGGGISYGLSSAQGRRRDMQDDHNAIAGIPQINNDVSWFAVFDGHGGSTVSKYCSDHLFRALIMDTELMNVLDSGLGFSKPKSPRCLIPV